VSKSRSRNRRRTSSAKNRSARKSRAGQGRLAKLVKNPLFLVGSSIIAAIGVVAAVTGPAPDLFKDDTEVSNFSATPINKAGVTRFLLPLDVPLDRMPPTDTGLCGPNQITWLKQHGTEIPPYERIAITNTAQDGAMLGLTNVRAVDVVKSPPRPSIFFDCPDAGAGDNAILNLRLDRDQQPAELFDLETEKTSPFSFNLAPGEQGSIELRLLGDEENSYQGRIVADVSTGGVTKTVDLPLNARRDAFDRTSPGNYGRLKVEPSPKHGMLYCLLLKPGGTTDNDRDLQECGLARIRQLLDQIAP